MQRNRIRAYLTERAQPSRDERFVRDESRATVAQSSFVMIPPALLAELSSTEQRRLGAIYQEASLRADAQIRRDCVERLLESIVA